MKRFVIFALLLLPSTVCAQMFVIADPKDQLVRVTTSQAQTYRYTYHVIKNTGTTMTATWLVNGVVGGDSTNGTITQANPGLYTPPTSIPTNPEIRICARADQDSITMGCVNARIVPGVTVPCRGDGAANTPVRCYTASYHMRVSESRTFSVTVTGGSPSTVTWYVNRIAGGNSTVGTITSGGAYTAPSSVPGYGRVVVTAVSDADTRSFAAIEVVITPAKYFNMFPTSFSILPNWYLSLQHFTNVLYQPVAPATNTGQLISYSTTIGSFNNGVNSGDFQAPLTAGTGTITGTSVVDATFTATSSVTVTTGAGSSGAILKDTWTKVRPYDLNNAWGSCNPAGGRQQYISCEVVITTNTEDLSSVNVSLTDFSDGLGNTIAASGNTVIYREDPLNIFYQSRYWASSIGEFPDVMVPKVDPVHAEDRGSFPFNVNRISRAYQKYPKSGNGTGAFLATGTMSSGGTYSDANRVVHLYDVVIDSVAGGTECGLATFKWNIDGGAFTTGVNAACTATTLSNGLTVTFANGSPTPSFTLNQEWWVWAGPLRNQPVWIDVWIPTGQTPGRYTSTVTVTKNSGAQTIATLTMPLTVWNFTIPLGYSGIQYYVEGFGDYNSISTYHGTTCSNSTAPLMQRYQAIAAINRISYPNMSNCYGPADGTHNSDGTLTASLNYSNFDTQMGCVMGGGMCPDGSPTPQYSGFAMPHGLRMHSINILPLPTSSNDQNTFYNRQDEIAHLRASANFKAARFIDYHQQCDERANEADFDFCRKRFSLEQAASTLAEGLITNSYSDNSYKTWGYPAIYSMLQDHLEERIYEEGTSEENRETADYFSPIPPGTALHDRWWYDSCDPPGCGAAAGADPGNGIYPTVALIDDTALDAKSFGVFSPTIYRVNGFLYYSGSQGIQQANNEGTRRVSPWDSQYLSGNNGDGALFYPGCMAAVGNCDPKFLLGGTSTKDIGIESLRMKYAREAMDWWWIARELVRRGDVEWVQGKVQPLAWSVIGFDRNAASWSAIWQAMGDRLGRVYGSGSGGTVSMSGSTGSGTSTTQ